ncbi:hypothetical protein [Actinoplanes aureus]|uniref:Uncharacterized protein n=1 Tax=Actinoplanes aureus TaxID=2792083 RepID=A0A931C9D8_9ACTN|nr:hypothetical protein [Actinoplanes aureus]MBG0562466.1 hypothetical protein [Actinoplanes aureus]
MPIKRAPRTVGAGLVVASVVIFAWRAAANWYPGWALLAAASVVLLIGLALLTRRALLRRRAVAWAGDAGWTAAGESSRPWPWQELRLRGDIRVTRAWTREVDGLPVTTGEIHWTGGALAGLVLARAGRGVFVVVGLPRPVPEMGLRLPYRFVGDWPRQTDPEVRQAFLDGLIAPWTVRGGELFTIEPQGGLFLDPAAFDRTVRRALRTVALLHLTQPNR